MLKLILHKLPADIASFAALLFMAHYGRRLIEQQQRTAAIVMLALLVVGTLANLFNLHKQNRA